MLTILVQHASFVQTIIYKIGVYVSYSTVPGIYGSKQTESEGVAQVTTTINPWPPVL